VCAQVHACCGCESADAPLWCRSSPLCEGVEHPLDVVINFAGGDPLSSGTCLRRNDLHSPVHGLDDGSPHACACKHREQGGHDGHIQLRTLNHSLGTSRLAYMVPQHLPLLTLNTPPYTHTQAHVCVHVCRAVWCPSCRAPSQAVPWALRLPPWHARPTHC